ncbi:MAG: CDP-glycerol glycerophosphotransferase [[Pasteurella] mairii]|uniref:Uncharacterized protein n=1 Tax=[Pasteurella] mairii TaxID=757 RepID=A0A379B1P4_9PAST|nr:CDP-glycerol glycerophosphotransferase [[Pasteurella] mairii]SUB32543.1 Uncharacterised protein [[Pasteurella] mairii]
MSNFEYYIYLDSKILGTARQITVYFEQGIFSPKDTLILIKKYKHKSAKRIADIFTASCLNFRFISMGDLDNLKQGILFYPFNAQSNVRAVANRKLTHVFITHGESSKISSVKPIIRIYDYVITAGQAGIDRFIAHGIFTQHDIKLGKFIKMGDTFIGKTGLNTLGHGKPCLFYAPTWEGGIEQENYSSLDNILLVAYTLRELASQYRTNEVVIRPHPNTGHRLKNYRQKLLALIRYLSANGLEPAVFTKNFTASWLENLQFKRYNVKKLTDLSSYTARFALCDISAIETQLLNENIPYHLYWDQTKHPNAFVDATIYENTRFVQKEQRFITLTAEQIDDMKFKHYLIDEKINTITLSQRITILLHKIYGGTIL